VRKEKIRSFFLSYGKGTGPDADRQRQVLAALEYSEFRAADDGYLDPIRVMVADQKLTEAKAKGDAAGVTEPTTFAAVKALIEKGYITRRHNPGNRRKFYVYLTPAGAALRDMLVPLAEEVNRIAVDGIPPEHLSTLRETLLKMIANLADEKPI